MSEQPCFDLLNDRIVRAHNPSAPPSCHSLPEILALLSDGATLEFPGLQAHQAHAWHAFLCHLGAIALHRGGEARLTAKSAAEWRALLKQLAQGQPEPWRLIVTDLSKPAFLQPPVPEGSLDAWKNEASEPDVIDVLVTAKNHDVKRRRAARSAPEHWVYSLVSLQTTDGFAGKNNYGVVRMNGGYGNRAAIGIAASDQASVRFRRDCSLLLERREQIASDFGFAERDGVALLWLEPWTGTTSMPLARCDPLFVEICRRVRLQARGSKITARFTGTTAPRLDGGETHGNVGDPWIPVRKADAAGLTAKNLSYNILQEVLFGGDYQPSAASFVRPEDGDHPVIVGRILARGQGKTEGYYERMIPCPPKAATMLGSLDGRQSLGSMARDRVELATRVRNKVLKPAILNLLQGGPDKLLFDDDRAEPFSRQFEDRVDDAFFRSLFEAVDLPPVMAKRQWVDLLLDFARGVLDEAIRGTPIPIARRYRAITAAERVFYGAARKHFADNFPAKGGPLNAELTDEH
ncbi:MAG: type I-E CRISPR-associated protein Cse1/CasA [Candidatus Binatia bacterium]